MSDAFTFRYRFTLTPGTGLPFETTIAQLAQDSDLEIAVKSVDEDIPLNKAKEVVLRGSGWRSEEIASAEGRKYRDRFILALVRHRVGVRPVDTIQKRAFFHSFLRSIAGESGRPVLNDEYDIMVFPSEPPPLFARMPEAQFTILPPESKLIASFSQL